MHAQKAYSFTNSLIHSFAHSFIRSFKPPLPNIPTTETVLFDSIYIIIFLSPQNLSLLSMLNSLGALLKGSGAERSAL